MWFTRTTDGIRGWFRLQSPSGALRTGAVPGDFVATVVDPANSVTSIVAVAESIKAGVYYFDVPSVPFLTANGTGFYAVTVEVSTAGAPKVKATFTKVIQVEAKGFADVGTGITPTAVAAAVWDEPRASHALAGTFGEFVNVDEDAIRLEIMSHVLEANTPGLTLEATVNLIRKIATNRLELKDGTTDNLQLWDDNGTTLILEWNQRDKSGTDIQLPQDAPARRGIPDFSP
jgi:hypothetical protein